MEKVARFLLALLRYFGTSLLVAVGLFVGVSLSCLVWGPCTSTVYSERMFWTGLAAIVVGMPAIFSALSVSRGYYDNPFTAGIDSQVADTIVKDGRLSLTKRSNFAWRMFTIGLFGIGFAALIDVLGLSLGF